MKTQEQILQEQNTPKWWDDWETQNTSPENMTNELLKGSGIEIPQ